MKFVLLINLKLQTIANSLFLNIAEHEFFSANKYENANYIVGIFIFISRENFMLNWVEHEKNYNLEACLTICLYVALTSMQTRAFYVTLTSMH